MCGISAIINRCKEPVDDSRIKAMTDIVGHRGPDSDGYFSSDNFALGHRRLAIIDLSPTGNQPMHYLNRYTIITNGEIYNYIELREELKKEGYSFRSQSDTEVILAAYDHWGFECVNKFNGMWAFVLYDSRKKIFFCSRDRFGIKPFYYTLMNNHFLIGSEIKQFTTQPGWQAHLNHRRAYDFLVYGVRNQSRDTLFNNISQLPGGHNLVYHLDSDNYEITQWYNPETAIRTNSPDFIEAQKQFSEIFTDAVRLRLRSDVKVGSCLSGGIDSSSIVCLANRLLRQEKAQDRQETVSSCFDIREYDEQAYINEVIQKTGVIPHRVYPRVDDLFNYLNRIIWHQDEPFVSTSIFAQWEVFKRAAENNITVMLDGQGADELLGGYHIFYGKFLARLIMPQKWARLITEVKHINQLHGYKPSQTARMATGNLPPVFLRKIFRQLFPNELSSTINRNGITREFEPWQKPTRTMLEESLAEIRFTHLPILLHYEDRNSMAHSIESRLPFLDYRLVEFVLGLPDRYKIYEATTKYILRQSLKDIVPESIINRSDKMGFVTPEEIWIKSNNEVFRKELIETIKISQGLINDKILNFFDAIVHNKRHFDFTIWRYIAFGRWLKTFNILVKV